MRRTLSDPSAATGSISGLRKPGASCRVDLVVPAVWLSCSPQRGLQPCDYRSPATLTSTLRVAKNPAGTGICAITFSGLQEARSCNACLAGTKTT